MATLESKHKKVAIIPFDVEVQYNKLPKNVTLEQIRENENDLGFVLQNQMYNQFLRKRDQFMIDFQDVDQTVMMLKRNKIDIEKLDEFSKDELARLLEVDAIISGHLITSKTYVNRGSHCCWCIVWRLGSNKYCRCYGFTARWE